MKPPRPPNDKRILAGRTNDKARIGLLLVLSIIFVVGYAFLRIRAADVDVPVADEIVGQPPEAYREIVRKPSARIDTRLLADVHDDARTDRLVREPDAYTHLLSEARKLTPGDLDALGMTAANPTEILADPAAHRGRAYFVKGVLETISAVEGSRYQEIRGTVVDPSGQRYAFSVLREPDAAVGDVVRLSGFFFKCFAVETAPGEYDDNAIYLVGRSLNRAFYEMEPLTDLSVAPLEQLTDFDVADRIELQEEILFQVLNFVRSISPEETDRLEYEEVSWADLRRDPDAYRGRPIRVFANFYPSLQWPRKLGPEGENPLEIPLFHEGIIKLPNDKLFRWIGLKPIDPNSLTRSRLIYLSGIFYKNFAWENGRGDVLTAPLIVATKFEPHVLPRNLLVEYMGIGIAALTIFVVFVLVVVVFADRRKSAHFRQEFLRRKRRSLARSLQASATDPQPPNDET